MERVAEQYDDIHLNENREKHALFACSNEIKACVDPFAVISSLIAKTLLDKNVLDDFSQRYQHETNREVICEDMLTVLISQKVRFQSFVHVLDECGYKELAARLNLLYVHSVDPSSTGVGKSNKLSSRASKYFSNLKRLLQNGVMKESKTALQQLTERFVKRLKTEKCAVIRQELADKCILTVCAEADAKAISFDENLHDSDVFSRFHQFITQSSNTLISRAMYFGRLANAYAMVGKFDESEHFMTEARSCAFHLPECLEVTNIFYIDVYIKLWQYETNPTQELRHEIFLWARMGLQSVNNETDENRMLWTRLFDLKMVFTLLGLGNRGVINKNCVVQASDVSQAKELLADVDKHWTGIANRRKMNYYVARARILQLEGHDTLCLNNLGMALGIAKDGQFKEKEFISKYFASVESNISGHGSNSHHSVSEFQYAQSWKRNLADSIFSDSIFSEHTATNALDHFETTSEDAVSCTCLKRALDVCECSFSTFSEHTATNALDHFEIYSEDATSCTCLKLPLDVCECPFSTIVNTITENKSTTLYNEGSEGNDEINYLSNIGFYSQANCKHADDNLIPEINPDLARARTVRRGLCGDFSPPSSLQENALDVCSITGPYALPQICRDIPTRFSFQENSLNVQTVIAPFAMPQEFSDFRPRSAFQEKSLNLVSINGPLALPYLSIDQSNNVYEKDTDANIGNCSVHMK
ncbi:uncharacterized protein LOC128239404 [Mya arenaria]|uniref:uncharacterized protein LOC128239404 n=1 Tax=Mya arenaria TaxID=6604 RepID=UPI0022E17DAA|nr:uncharacterized protein LOC128239404 [Mya arenaria]